MKDVDIAVAGRFHAHHLASEIARLSRLRAFYCAHRKWKPPRYVQAAAFHNRIDLVARSLLSRLGPFGITGERKAEIFDRWLATRLARKPPGVLHSWNGNSWETFKRLRGTGWLLCVERSCPHNRFQYDLLVEEGRALGIPHHQDQRALDRAIEELHLADVIVAPSRYSARSYTQPELARKVRINPLGANVAYSERAQAPHDLRVLLVGNNFLRKGTHYLIEAFRRIDDPRAQLWIRGDVPEVYRKLIRDSRITIFPAILPGKLRELYRCASVFVQPSIDEGFGMTVLEALGHGLPLVVTENVGARDLLDPQVAVTVPIRDPDAIAAAILEARRLPGPGFDAARKVILEKNGWAACARRMIDDVYTRRGTN
jgi:glycosyltransferase involved in cell wall biosynthesis